MLATYLNRRARRLDRALGAVDVDLPLGIVHAFVLRIGSERVFLAVFAAACRSVCGLAGSLLLGGCVFVCVSSWFSGSTQESRDDTWITLPSLGTSLLPAAGSAVLPSAFSSEDAPTYCGSAYCVLAWSSAASTCVGRGQLRGSTCLPCGPRCCFRPAAGSAVVPDITR